MAQGSKKKYTDKQKRKAAHIEESYEERGLSEQEAERRAWATVNKIDGGGKKSGSGRGKKAKKAAVEKGGKKAKKKPGPKQGTKKSTKKSKRKAKNKSGRKKSR